ncbi:SRPBCC family protein [Marimonas arenosa]|uniref:SRPBCC family protein n=1 Tax=Marimonas arenosa TaxID=1795305 RepID=A0AAE3WAT9_9RHOB|nr:SRPBCC family protein [Marimonas arenosa]MDQ2088397.1 SRPBCC family protein [Marimonas arenosa]
MFRLIYRQRRRLLFGWFFFLLTVFTMFFHSNGHDLASVEPSRLLWGLPLLFAAGLAMTGAVFAVIALLVAVMPRWRHIVELTFVMVFLEVALGLSPRIAALLGLPPGYSGFVWFFIFVALFSVTYGVALDRFRFALAWRSTRIAKLPLPPEEVWKSFAIRDHGPEGHWAPLLHRVEPHPDDPDTLDVLYKLGPSTYEHQTQQVLESTAPTRYRYRFFGDTASPNRALTTGEFEVQIAPDGAGGSHVTVSERHDAMLPRDALNLWFDDFLGDTLDAIRARTLGKRDWSIRGLAWRKILSLS